MKKKEKKKSKANLPSLTGVAELEDGSSTSSPHAEKVKDLEDQDPDVVSKTSHQHHLSTVDSSDNVSGKIVTLYGVNRPFFHVDVASALESALAIVDGTVDRHV